MEENEGQDLATDMKQEIAQKLIKDQELVTPSLFFSYFKFLGLKKLNNYEKTRN